jgi:hypothetical protein
LGSAVVRVYYQVRAFAILKQENVKSVQTAQRGKRICPDLADNTAKVLNMGLFAGWPSGMIRRSFLLRETFLYKNPTVDCLNHWKAYKSIWIIFIKFKLTIVR